MRKLVCFCLFGLVFASSVAVNAQEDPPARVRQVCDPALPENAGVCVDDTFEVVFGTDKASTDSVYQYASFVANTVIDAMVVTDTKSDKVQGWSYGVAHDMSYLTISEVTIGGTDAETALIGGFDATSLDVEKCDTKACPNRTKGGGFISAVVLSLKKPVQLTKDQRNLICKMKYTLTADAGAAGTYIEISNLLAAVGSPPADVNITIDGASKKWTNATDGWVKLEAATVETDCDNGVDDDGDQQTDCCDTDCAGVAPCEAAESLCADGKDNDCDGKTDCADEDCADDLVACPPGEDPPPRVRQICDPTLPENAGVCVDDTFEVVFGTDKTVKDSVYQYDAFVSDTVIDAMVVTDTKSDKVQGWSYGVAHDMSYLTIAEVTIGGTDAETALIGGFDATSLDVDKCDTVACPNRTKGGGFISAVVLSLKKPVQLTKDQRNLICKMKYTLTADPGSTGTYIEISNLLAAVGSPPADVNLTIDGASKKWTNATDGWVKLRGGVTPPETNCTDDIDNDGDQKTDCDDEDCAASPACAPPQDKFQRGDANDDGKVNIADPIWIINELVRQGPATSCQDAADANDDGTVDLSDAMYLIDWRFRGQSAPPAPGPLTCGDDVGADSLSCPEGSTTHCP